MISALDSTVLVAALIESEMHHAECAALLDQRGNRIYAHGLTETFAFLTGGRAGHRIAPETAAILIERSIIPSLEIVSLAGSDIRAALKETQRRGVRGGAIYDYLHLAAARKARAERLYTLNVADFQSFHRTGDPVILHP